MFHRTHTAPRHVRSTATDPKHTLPKKPLGSGRHVATSLAGDARLDSFEGAASTDDATILGICMASNPCVDVCMTPDPCVGVCSGPAHRSAGGAAAGRNTGLRFFTCAHSFAILLVADALQTQRKFSTGRAWHGLAGQPMISASNAFFDRNGMCMLMFMHGHARAATKARPAQSSDDIGAMSAALKLESALGTRRLGKSFLRTGGMDGL